MVAEWNHNLAQEGDMLFLLYSIAPVALPLVHCERLSHLSHVHTYDRLLEKLLLPLVTDCIFTLYHHLHTPMCLETRAVDYVCVGYLHYTPFSNFRQAKAKFQKLFVHN